MSPSDPRKMIRETGWSGGRSGDLGGKFGEEDEREGGRRYLDLTVVIRTCSILCERVEPRTLSELI